MMLDAKISKEAYDEKYNELKVKLDRALKEKVLLEQDVLSQNNVKNRMQYIRGKIMNNKYGKKIFITGATSGIGKACAIRFANAGCEVIGTTLHGTYSEESFPSGGTIKIIPMDVTDDESVATVIEKIEEIDVAILSAGMGVAGAAEELPMELAKKQMDVNYFGVLRVGRQILPKMRKQGKGLVLIISSIAGKVPIPMQSHYSSSKYALEAYAQSARMEMKEYGVKVCLVEPGDTHTGFTDNRQSYYDKNSVYYKVSKKSIGKMEQDELNGRSPDSVAKVCEKLVSRKNPPIRVAVGIEYKLLMFLLRFMPDRFTLWILGKLYL